MTLMIHKLFPASGSVLRALNERYIQPAVAGGDDAPLGGREARPRRARLHQATDAHDGA